MEGGNAVADALSGKATPSGKLPDTVAYDIEDYPANDNFGNEFTNLYKEDIYVGYRYFETFAPEKFNLNLVSDFHTQHLILKQYQQMQMMKKSH